MEPLGEDEPVVVPEMEAATAAALSVLLMLGLSVGLFVPLRLSEDVAVAEAVPPAAGVTDVVGDSVGVATAENPCEADSVATGITAVGYPQQEVLGFTFAWI